MNRFLSTLWATTAAFALALASAQAAAPQNLQTSPRMADETRNVVYCIEKLHYLRMPISQVDANEFLKSYMTTLDFLHLFFLQKDLEEAQTRFSPGMDLYLHQGNLLPALTVFETLRERVQARAAWINKRLDGDFNLADKTTFAPDRTEAPWPATAADADQLWEARLEYDLINELLGTSATKTETKTQAEAPTNTPAPATPSVPTDVPQPPTRPKASKTTESADLSPEALRDPARIAEAKANIRKRYDRLAKSFTDMDSSEVQEIYLNALARMYDPHTGFLSQNMLDDFDISMRNSLVGIGAMLSDEDGYCTVKELIPGGPAEKSRLLRLGDQIVGVAQGDAEFVDVIGMKLRKIVAQIRGKKGSEVRLLVRPGSGDPSERRIVSLERDEIRLTANLARAEVYDVPLGDRVTVPVGVIDLPAFYSGDSGDSPNTTTQDVNELLQKLKKLGVKGIVLDLRRNGGGFLTEAITLTGLFIPSGPVLQVRDTLGRIEQFRDRDGKVAWDGPLMVLVSRFSASAAEIVAGALQNHHRALIVGDSSTHGKGTVQAMYNLGNFNPTQKGAAKVTVQKWYMPNGNSIQIRGINSDIVIPSVAETLPVGEGRQPRALEWDAIPAIAVEPAEKYTSAPVTTQLVENLRSKSDQRVGTLPEFSLLKERISWEKVRIDQKEFSLNLDERQDQRKADNAFRKKLETTLKTMADNSRYPFQEILLDTSAAAEKKREEIVARNEQPGVKLASATNGEKDKGKQTRHSRRHRYGEDEDENENPDFDIHLRESLRIMADWIETLNPKPDAQPATPPAKLAQTVESQGS